MTSMKMLLLFLFAVAILNLTNYMFFLFNPPIRTKAFRYKPVVSTTTNTPFTAKLLCLDKNEDHMKNNTIVVDEHYDEVTLSTKGLFTHYYMRAKRIDINLCPEIPPDLGAVQNDPSLSTLEAFDRIYTEVQIGGSYSPINCTARQTVAIIIPYRASKKVNNGKHLGTFLYMLHPFLMKQQLEYQVFVVEQANLHQSFNHGKLLNAGFTEVQRRLFKEDHFYCIIIHEPYIVPLDTRNLYRCGRYPRQLAVTVEGPDKSNYQPMFGGVVAISTEQFISINGFSNIYWDSDADYEDLYKRLLNASYRIDRNSPDIGQYKTLKNYDLPDIKKSIAAQTASPMNLVDGLTTLSYTLNNFELKYIFTHINVTLEEESSVEDIKSQNQIVKTILKHTT